MGIYKKRHWLMASAVPLRTSLRLGVALFFIGTCMGTTAFSVAAQEQDVQDLILEVRMGQAIITPATTILESQGRYYLPLVDIAENYEFVITDSDLTRGYVEGWYISEDNTFSVDREKKEAYHKGTRIELSDIDFIDDPYEENNELYLQLPIFNKIWPEITFTVDMASLQLRAESDTKFPFMERKERKQRQKIVAAQRETKVGPEKPLPYISNPYRLVGKPTLDIDSNTGWKSEERAVTGQLSLNGVQDLAWMTAEYGLTVDRDAEGFQRPDALRLTFSRETTPDAPLPLGLEKAEFGDTRLNYREIVGNGSTGRGVFVTTDRNDNNGSFDVITVEGNGPPGWETELYRNNELIDFGVVDERGEYRFEDVSTQYGNNRIRVVLYGPQGQIREDVKDYNFASTMLRAGEHSFEAGFVDSDRDFIRLSDEDQTRPEGIARSFMGSYGLNRNLTAFASYNAMPTSDGDKSYVSTGVTFAAGGGYGQAEVFQQIGEGRAVDLRYLTELLGFRLNMVSSFFNKFESTASGFNQSAKKNEQSIVASRNFRLPFGSLGLQFDAERTRRINDTIEVSLRARQTLGSGGFQLTHQFDARLVDGHHDRTGGNFSTNIRMQKWRLRSGLNYTYYPETRFTGVDAELRYQTRDDFIAALRVNNDFVEDKIGVGGQLGYDFKKFLGSVDTNWREDAGWEVLLRASTSLGPYGEDGGYNMVSESQRSLAPVRGHAFLDHNYNSLFDEGDEALTGARLNIDGRPTLEESGETGYMVARSYDKPGTVNIALEKNSLDDPYYAPAHDGYSLAPRPGSLPTLDFPVIETGAIDGTIYGADSGDPVQGIDIQLVDDKGVVVMATKAAYDGFYTFEFGRPGAYTVRVDPALQVNVPPVTVTVASDELFASGIDLTLLGQVSEADGVLTTADAQAAADQESFDAEFEKALIEESAEGVTAVEPRSGAENGRVAQPYHETHNGTLMPAPHSSDGSLSAVVHRVRAGKHPDKVRLVMELSGPVNYKILPGSDQHELIIELPDVAWDALLNGKSDVVSYDAEALTDKDNKAVGTKLHLRSAQAISVQGQELLKPDGAAGHRLYIDFKVN